MIYLVALLLGLWFWRRNFSDASFWMIATYAGIGLVFWTDYTAVSADGGMLNEALPRIVRDFLLLGMVGFVQSLAVNKRMPIWLAVILTLVIFAAAHFLEFEAPGQGAEGSGTATPAGPLSTYTAPAAAPEFDATAETVVLDPAGEYLVQLRDKDAVVAFLVEAHSRGWTADYAFTPDHPEVEGVDLEWFMTVDVADEAAAATALRKMDGVVYFEGNERITVDPLTGNDNLQRREPILGINDPETGQQWAMSVLQMDAYYRLLANQTPVKKARIAILDTGVDSRHEDLNGNFVSIDAKYDNDPQGHGTHCAGIAAGVTNNGIGIGSLAGIGKSPFVELTSVKVLNASGMGTQKSIVAGIIEAADEGADVISLSLGGPSNSSRQRAYSQAVKYAQAQGAIVLSAAGNSNRNAKDYSPANAKGMIAVAALDQDLKRAVFSNTVQNVRYGIAAPGVGIFSTLPNNTYKMASGTSMACPFVAGLIGVMRSLDPELTTATAYDILHDTGKETVDGKLTGRVVQPAAAIGRVLASR